MIKNEVMLNIFQNMFKSKIKSFEEEINILFEEMKKCSFEENVAESVSVPKSITFAEPIANCPVKPTDKIEEEKILPREDTVSENIGAVKLPGDLDKKIVEAVEKEGYKPDINTSKDIIEEEFQAQIPEKLVLQDDFFSIVNPIRMESNFIDETVITFSIPNKTMDIKSFFVTFDFRRILNNYKYYSLNAIKQIFCAYTGRSPENWDILQYLNHKNYFKDVVAFKYNDTYAFSPSALCDIGQNILDGKIFEEDEKKKEVVIEAKQEEKTSGNFPEKASASDFMLFTKDLSFIEQDDLDIEGLCKVYNKHYNRHIIAQNFRNSMLRAGVSVSNTLGKNGKAKGKGLVKLIEIYRQKYFESPNKRRKEIMETARNSISESLPLS